VGNTCTLYTILIDMMYHVELIVLVDIRGMEATPLVCVCDVSVVLGCAGSAAGGNAHACTSTARTHVVYVHTHTHTPDPNTAYCTPATAQAAAITKKTISHCSCVPCNAQLSPAVHLYQPHRRQCTTPNMCRAHRTRHSGFTPVLKAMEEYF
jgi:hypothetical protein